MSICSTLRRDYRWYPLSKKVSTMEQTQNTNARAADENSSQTNQQNVRYTICGRNFKTNRGLLQHLNFWRRQNSELQQTVTKPEVQSNHNYDYCEGHSDGYQERLYWNEVVDQGLQLFFMMHTKRSLSGKEIFLCCQHVLLGRNI